MSDDQPVTRGELRAELREFKDEVTADMRQLESRLANELTATMRQIETNLLTAFHGYARGEQAHMHTLDTADQDLRIRMSALEDRVLNIEARMPPAA